MCTVVSNFSNPHFFEPSITSTKSHFSLQSVKHCNFTPLSRTSWFFIPVFVSIGGRKIGISLSVILNFTLKLNLRGLNCPLKLETVYMRLLVHSTDLRFKGRVTVNHSSFRRRELNYPGIISKSLYTTFRWLHVIIFKWKENKIENLIYTVQGDKT